MRRRLPGALAAAVVAVAILVGAVLWFGGTDAPSGEGAPAAAPGTPAPTRTQPELARGNVVLLVGDGQAAAARRLATDLAGPPPRALAAPGQAVLVRTRAGEDDVLATAYERELRAASADDASLRAFVERWLGRGSRP